ncbi:hypothetical protein F5B17DRAFT_446423 [Nemania serpens]|nr:hypothetical protein F5B17DRAFT_446423 [Nemania serpens]
MVAPRASTTAVADAADGQPRHILRQRHTRTRGGCERCRAQRRKCDEEKPRCRRCARADAACKYVANISFRDENSQMLSDKVSSDLIGTLMSSTKYHTIEFIHNDGRGQRGLLDASFCSLNDKRFGEQYVSANVTEIPSGLDLDGRWPLVGTSRLSTAEVELMKYYIHHVAPWLDLFDQGRTFGQHVTKLAMASPCVLEVLLQLSAVSSDRPTDLVTRRGAGVFHLQAMSNPPGADSPSSALRSIACFVLARTQLFVDAIPDTWERSFRGDGAFLYFRRFEFPDPTQRQMWFAFLTLILRLEIAYCLMNQKTPLWIPQLARQIQTQKRTNGTGGHTSQQVLDASLECLELLVEAMTFSFPASEASDNAAASGTYGANSWKELINRLRGWHKSRPSSLEPLIEIEYPGAVFPTVVFATGAGIAANTLYHAAMMLLLRNKPRSISLDEQADGLQLDSIQMSSEWHALRICGIAVNSEPENTLCWDPAMIAAFSLAALQITQRSQQNDILICLRRFRSAGWHVDSLINRLRGEWGPVDE